MKNGKRNTFTRDGIGKLFFKRFPITLLVAIVAFAGTFVYVDKETEREFYTTCNIVEKNCLSGLATVLYNADSMQKVKARSKRILCDAAKTMEDHGYTCYVSVTTGDPRLKPISDSTEVAMVHFEFDNEVNEYYYCTSKELIDYIKTKQAEIDRDNTKNDIYREVFFLPDKLYFKNQSEFETPSITIVTATYQIDGLTGKQTLLDTVSEHMEFTCQKAEEDYFKSVEIKSDYRLQDIWYDYYTISLIGTPVVHEDFLEDEGVIKMPENYFESVFCEYNLTSMINGKTMAFLAKYDRLSGRKNTYITFGVIYFLVSLIAALIWAYVTFVRNKNYFAMEDYRKNLMNCMAHDLKTPLTVMTGYADNLLSNVHEEKKEHYARAICENADYMNSLIENILKMSETEEEIKLNKTFVDLIELSKKLWTRYELSAEERKLSAEFSGSLTLSADETLISNAIDNLLSNAIKYSKEGTTVTVCGENGKYEIINIAEVPPTKNPDRLWKPFEKEEAARNGKTGNGLGLSIAGNILKLHGFTPQILVDGDKFTVKF